MPWAVAAAGVAAAGTIAGSEISSSGSQSAANTIANSANQANALAQRQLDQTQANLAPFLSGGTSALQALQAGVGLPVSPLNATQQNVDLFGPGMDAQRLQMWNALLAQNGGDPTAAAADWQQRATSGRGFADLVPNIATPGATGVTPGSLTRQPTIADFQASPGYNFALQQGIGAIDNSASARGVSGNTLRDLQTFGIGEANQDWWRFYNAFTGNQNRTINTLLNLSGAGQNAAVSQGGFGQNALNLISGNTTGAGSALAAGQIGSANALSGGANNLSNIAQQAFLSQNQQSSSPFDFIPGLSSAGMSPSILGGGGSVAAGTPPF